MSLFPYILAAKDDQTIYSPDCVPEGFTLSDPDHLTGSNIIALYHHWLERQNRWLSPFIVLNAHPNHVVILKNSQKSQKDKGKQKMEYVDDTEEDKEAEEEEEEGEEDEKEEEEEDEKAEEDKEAEEDEEDKEMPLAVKFGPPKGKEKKIASLAQDHFQVKGPSKLTPPPTAA